MVGKWVKKKWQKSSGGYKVRLFGQHEVEPKWYGILQKERTKKKL